MKITLILIIPNNSMKLYNYENKYFLEKYLNKWTRQCKSQLLLIIKQFKCSHLRLIMCFMKIKIKRFEILISFINLEPRN